ncbi:MAG: hypothetical protein AAGD14_07450 [Planctomycetota bacterium]
MHLTRGWAAVLLGALLSACSGGGSGASGDFALIEFLESGQNNIPRNRQIRFRFSAPVKQDQDLFTRLKIQNVISGPSSNFARAAGFYTLSGDIVLFTPRLPNKEDRSDAGFRANGNYVVFISGGPDGLQSTSGETIPTQQEFIFETNEFFEDVVPSQPPRSLVTLGLVAIDTSEVQQVPDRGLDVPDDVNTAFDVSRVDPRPTELALLDSATLIAAGRVIRPGGGTAPDYATPWQFDLRVSEPIDPAEVNTSNIQMFEVFSNATTSPETEPAAAPPGYFGDAVNFAVSIEVSTFQTVDTEGNLDTRIRIRPLGTLVDNTRYRIQLSGSILGLDFRKTFAGDNGLTGDGQTFADGELVEEQGGFGYVTEFIVSNEAPIRASRTVEYDPSSDGINPETGQTTLDPENGSNTALYNPAELPGTALGVLSAFGNASNGDLGISANTTINTGDTPNEPLGNPFQVIDLDAENNHLEDTRPGQLVAWDSLEPFELNLSNLTVSSAATLRIIGVNPILFRVSGLTQINGQIDLSGGNGGNGGSPAANGGTAGAGGHPGGSSRRGVQASSVGCNPQFVQNCLNFDVFLDGCNTASNGFPYSEHGNGPGRGMGGGEALFNSGNGLQPTTSSGLGSGTGGGGASHARIGGRGQDIQSAGDQAGTPGNGGCGTSFFNYRNSGVIGVRGEPGTPYGDRFVQDVTIGGSGGGSGGAIHERSTFSSNQAGGAGGGGGGSLTIISRGSILATGGVINADGGNGGRGGISGQSVSFQSVSGAGGGGSGGTIALISGDDLVLTGATITTNGGLGGLAANTGSGLSCTACNVGGAGGDGFIFLMDADGRVTGFNPSDPGEYDGDDRGVLTIITFDASRFETMAAITELFPMTAANPAYENYPDTTADLVGLVNPGQTIQLVFSSARSDPLNPKSPELTTEQTPFEVALLSYSGTGTVVTITDDLNKLNEDPANPNREAFVRVQALFEYANGIESALGPFAAIDEVTLNYNFN